MQIGLRQPFDVFFGTTKPKSKKKIFDRHHFNHSVVPVIQRNKLMVCTSSVVIYLLCSQLLLGEQLADRTMIDYERKKKKKKEFWDWMSMWLSVLTTTLFELHNSKIILPNTIVAWGKKLQILYIKFFFCSIVKLPVQCHSEKINIFWKVQILVKKPGVHYCIWCKVRHGQTWHMKRIR